MADSFFDMVVFVQVVKTGNLSAAARELSLSPAVVSRTLARLEERLGVRLANRTTRSLNLTEEGTAFHGHCVRILAQVEDAEREISGRKEVPTGLLRVTSTFAFCRRRLGPLLARFQKMYPELHVHLDATDRVTNIIDSGYDVAVRFGTLTDSSLIARQLAPNMRVICGSPDYLNRNGRPTNPDELLRHRCIVYGTPPLELWAFADGSVAQVRGTLACNDGDLAHSWAIEGGGLVLKSIWDVADDIQAGRLEIVLPEKRLLAAPIHAVYPTNRHVVAKVRLFVDYLSIELKKQSALFPSVLS